MAFAGRKDYSAIKHLVVPGVGLLLNIGMLMSILYLYITGNADAQHEAYICFGIAGGWAVISLIYVAVTSVRTGRPVIAAPRRA